MLAHTDAWCCTAAHSAARSPHDVGCEVGVCGGGEAPGHHFHHGHDHRRQRHLRTGGDKGTQPVTLYNLSYYLGLLRQGVSDFRLAGTAALLLITHLGEPHLSSQLTQLLLVLREDGGVLEHHRQAHNACMAANRRAE